MNEQKIKTPIYTDITGQSKLPPTTIEVWEVVQKYSKYIPKTIKSDNALTHKEYSTDIDKELRKL